MYRQILYCVSIIGKALLSEQFAIWFFNGERKDFPHISTAFIIQELFCSLQPNMFLFLKEKLDHHFHAKRLVPKFEYCNKQNLACLNIQFGCFFTQTIVYLVENVCAKLRTQLLLFSFVNDGYKKSMSLTLGPNSFLCCLI